MPFFGKKQDKVAEERLEALMARRKERKASCGPPVRAPSTEGEASSPSHSSCTTSDERHPVHSVATHTNLTKSHPQSVPQNKDALAAAVPETHGPNPGQRQQSKVKDTVEGPPSKGQSNSKLRFNFSRSKLKSDSAGNGGNDAGSAPPTTHHARESTSSSRRQSQPMGGMQASGSSESVGGHHDHSRPVKRQLPATVPSLQMAQSSRLNVTLLEILSQNSALPYFLPFAESAGCLSMVQFWMSVESFRVSSLRRLEKYRQTTSATVAVAPVKQSVFRSDSISSAQSPPAGQRPVPHSPEDRQHSDVIPIPVQEKTGGRSTPTPSPPAHSSSSSFPAQHNSAMLEFSPYLIPRQQSLSIQRDALAIYKQYVSMQARLPINIPIEVRQDIELGICQEDGFVSPEVFTEAQKTVFDLLQKHYYTPFLKSHFYCKFVIELLTSTALRLSDLMLGDVSAMVFTEYMEQEHGLNFFHFWTLANSFQLDLADQIAKGTYVGARAVDDAMAIYDRYFSLQATTPLYLGDEVRVAVEMAICCEVDGPAPDCFAVPMHHVYTIMEEEYFSQLLTSNLYFNFLSKLVNSVSEHRRADQEAIGPGSLGNHVTQTDLGRTDAGSGSPSATPAGGHKIMSQKSAQEALSAENVLNYFTQDAIGIDCGEDPDALWRQPKRPLNFAHITEMGEYITDLDPYPDIKETKVSFRVRMSHAVQKMMNTYVEDSEREEMASRVARMIVTNILQQTGQKDSWMLQVGSYDVNQTSPEIGIAIAGQPPL